MSRHLVFVYGTLKTGQPNYPILLNRQNGVSEFVANAKTTNKWPLIIASKYNVPFLIHKIGSGHEIVGQVFSVDDQMLRFLDDFECHPSYYTRLQTEVILENGSHCTPWTYFLMNYKPEMLDLPYYDNYSSYGSHGQRYVERCDRVVSDQSNDSKVLSQRTNSESRRYRYRECF